MTTPDEAYQVLVFSRTTGFRHDSIPAGIAAVRALGDRHGFGVDATECGAVFTDDTLPRYAAVVWLSTTGDVLDEPQRTAFQRYVEGGGGYLGVHAAADTEHRWPWYGGLVGARFHDHPATQPGTVRIEDGGTAATEGLPREWPRTDEWYNFRANPRGSVHVLATVDEATYDPVGYRGGAMGADHPVAWCHRYAGGRSVYTALGHTAESYREPAFLRHLYGALRMAAGTAPFPA
ncbi:ThuA domain-containing protein [Actinocatenispora rupis]|uniref:ThuA domain-containing protein n=1 Tax=Actinocatenispora rupis TaxID=519421 RepID=UPI001943E201|nr:ThuA domain-containing protein [Actinocatenispora rupis]